MASRIIGIDLGAYSVKAVIANPGFRGAQVVDYVERRVPAGDEPAPVRAARVLGDIIRDNQLGEDIGCVAVPGDQLFIHVLDFSFPSLKRTELEKVVGSELEDILPIDLEDMVFSFDVIPAEAGRDTEAPVVDLGAPISDEDPTFVQGEAAANVVHGRYAAPTEGMRVLSCAMPIERARAAIDRIEEQGIDARSLIPAPASYMRVAERIAALGEEKHNPVAIIDIGHARTDVCVVMDARVVYGRTIPRGGKQVTEVIARTWRMTEAEAENAKHTDGFVASAAEPATSDAWARIHEVIVLEVGPLARDLKTTLAACRAKTGAVVTRVEVVGGGSRLRGLPAFLSEKLRLPVTTLDPADDEAILGSRLASMGVKADTACLAAGVAFEGATGRPHFDLRSGALALKADLGFLRQKLPALAAAALVIIAFASFNAYARLHKLRKSERILDERLAVETTALFGESLSARATINRVGDEDGGDGADSPMPRMTAYDLLLDVSSRMPPNEEIKVDITQIDLKPGKIAIKATTGTTEKHDAVEASAEIIKALKAQPCFEEVTRGTISSGPNDTKNFPVTIKETCR